MTHLCQGAGGLQGQFHLGAHAWFLHALQCSMRQPDGVWCVGQRKGRVVVANGASERGRGGHVLGGSIGMGGCGQHVVGSGRQDGAVASDACALSPGWGTPPAKLGRRALEKASSLAPRLGEGGGALLVGDGSGDGVWGNMGVGGNSGEALVDG